MIITECSILNPHLSMGHLSLILKIFRDRNEPFVETVDLDEHNAPHVQCDLYGPLMDDPPISDEHAKVIDNRRTISIGQRLALSLPIIRRSNLLTVVAGSNGVLYRAYGGPITPEFPTECAGEAFYPSKRFWQQHALGVGLDVSGI